MRENIFNSATIEQMLETSHGKWHVYPSDTIPVWIADPDFPVAEEIKQVLIEAVQTEDLFYRNDRKARDAMAKKVSEQNAFEVTPNDVMVTQGVLPSMWLAAQYACHLGDEAIITDPMYAPFELALKVSGVKSIYWPLYEGEGYRFEIDVLNELVTKKSKLLFLCNPHNPCGRVMTKRELKGIADIAIDNDLTVMVDELWEDIIFDGRKHISLASLNPEIEDRTITSLGFSKTYGVAGLQIGYLVTTNKWIMARLRRIALGILRGTSTLALTAAPIMLDKTLEWWRIGIVEHLQKMKTLAEHRFAEMPNVTCPKLEGTYLMFPKFDYKMTTFELWNFMLNEAKVAFMPGHILGSQGENHLRITIATSETILNEVFNRVEKALEIL
jgi:bifunctional pyridoxal-dependent enzyme with beta-cystathionase and maltose regulon repressor activities